MNELISIVVPIYNVENYLEKCIKTLINQTYKNIEIILVDDGSKDSSGEICNEYQKKDERIKVIHKENGGLSDARNAGIKEATGKYIAFLDADDYVDYTMYEKLYNVIKEENAEIAICGYSRINEKDKEMPYPLEVKKYKKDRSILYNMIGTLPKDSEDINIGMSVWKCLYNLEVIKKNNLYFRSERVYISEDIVFQIEYFEFVNKVALLGDPLYKYRYNEVSLSKKYRKDRFEKQKILYLKEKSMLEERKWLDKELNNRLDRTFIMKVKACIKSEVVANTEIKEKKLQNIKKILEDDLLQKIIKEYPVNETNFKSRIYILIMKFKLNKLLYKMYNK